MNLSKIMEVYLESRIVSLLLKKTKVIPYSAILSIRQFSSSSSSVPPVPTWAAPTWAETGSPGKIRLRSTNKDRTPNHFPRPALSRRRRRRCPALRCHKSVPGTTRFRSPHGPTTLPPPHYSPPGFFLQEALHRRQDMRGLWVWLPAALRASCASCRAVRQVVAAGG
jgi:hypothetical protein